MILDLIYTGMGLPTITNSEIWDIHQAFNSTKLQLVPRRKLVTYYHFRTLDCYRQYQFQTHLWLEGPLITFPLKLTTMLAIS